MSSDITILPPGSNAVTVAAPGDISGAANDADLVALWLSEARSDHTLELYERVAARLLRTLPHGLKRATVSDVKRFEDSLKVMKLNSRYTMMSAIRSLFSFAQKTGYIPLSPAHVRRNRKPAHSSLSKCLTEHEVWAVIDAADGDRDQLLLRFFYGTAVRISELRGLVWADIFIHDNTQKAQILGKGGRYRQVPIPAWVKLVRPPEALSDDAVFPAAHGAHPWQPMSESNIRRIIDMAALKAGIKKKVSPHWFRHTALTHIQDKGVDIRKARDLAGHANINTTSGYSHTLDMGVPGDVLERKK